MGVHQLEPENLYSKSHPRKEKRFRFLFHWIKRKDWENALGEVNEPIPNYFPRNSGA